MNRKLVADFLKITFGIMIPFWVGCAVLSQWLDLTVNHPLLRSLHLAGGFSPTIASFWSLKRNGLISGFRPWLRQCFVLRQRPAAYGTVALFVGSYYLLGCLINGFTQGAPVFLLVVLVPMMLFGGGNEEAGWRMILQPELEKRFGFHVATWITAGIWWLWHLPIFFIQGTANADMNYFLFGCMCLNLSYGFAAIRRLSKGPFPCILAHCLINGLSGIFLFQFSLVGCLLTLAVTVLLSCLVVKDNK